VSQHDERDEEAGGTRSSRSEGEHAPGASSGGDRDSEEHVGGPEREAADVPDSPPPKLEPSAAQTPLFHAQHSDRYARQALIREYEAANDCRLAVMIDVIFPPSVTLFEELIWDADPDQDLHVLLESPGGDGETAVRLSRAAQSRCRELTIIVPNQAKSAGTIFVIGAHHVLMGPTSDLGPVDPQFPQPEGTGLYAAKDLIAAVEQAEAAIAANPDTYPLYAALLADVTAVMVQQARSAMERTEDLVLEALSSNPDRSEADVKRIASALKEKLIDLPRDHGAVFGARDAQAVELPVRMVHPQSEQWRMIWRLWTKYFVLDSTIYEGRTASQVLDRIGVYS
jgi:Serine dehydrogenase proteinase